MHLSTLRSQLLTYSDSVVGRRPHLNREEDGAMVSLLRAAAGAQECAGEENRLLSGHLDIPGAKLAFTVF